MADVEHIQIDRRRIVHYLGVVFAGKDVTRATHIGSELIYLIEAAVDNSAAGAVVPQVTNDKVIGFGLRKFVKFQINTAHPEALTL